MDEILQNGLRWALLASEDTWREDLHRALDRGGGALSLLQEVRLFLADRLAAADATYQPRMQSMIGEVSARIDAVKLTARGPWAESVQTWLEAIDAIEAARAALAAAESKLNDAQSRLLDALALNESRDAGGWRITRVPGKAAVRVIDPQRVPVSLCRAMPDEDAIRRQWTMTGRPPPGTLVLASPGEIEAVRLV